MAGSQFCYWVKDTVLNVKQIECAKPNINLGKRCLIRNGFLSQLLSRIRQWVFYHMIKDVCTDVCTILSYDKIPEIDYVHVLLILAIACPNNMLGLGL